jgi:hypothetical protein
VLVIGIVVWVKLKKLTFLQNKTLSKTKKIFNTILKYFLPAFFLHFSKFWNFLFIFLFQGDRKNRWCVWSCDFTLQNVSQLFSINRSKSDFLRKNTYWHSMSGEKIMKKLSSWEIKRWANTCKLSYLQLISCFRYFSSNRSGVT